MYAKASCDWHSVLIIIRNWLLSSLLGPVDDDGIPRSKSGLIDTRCDVIAHGILYCAYISRVTWKKIDPVINK